MITIQTGCTISLSCCTNDIKDFTMNHCDFIFLDYSGRKVIKQTQTMRECETILLEQKYRCLCFDCRENCYWAVPDGDAHLICQLDENFCEVGTITVEETHQQRAISICCDDCGKGLWVGYPCHAVFIEKSSMAITWYKNEDNLRMNVGVLMQRDCWIRGYSEGTRQMLRIESSRDSQSIELCIPKGYKLTGISGYCGDCKKTCRFYVLLANTCNHEYVLMEYCVEFSHGSIEPCEPQPCLPHPCPPPCPPHPCPPRPCPPRPCPPCPCPPHPCPPRPCPPRPCPPCPCPPHPCPPEPHCGGSYEIMHSIALEEAGISHILNAEGEKIQKAVAMSSSIEELICVNESVKRTLTQVTLLEGMLYSKLEVLVNCNDSCHGGKPHCYPPVCDEPHPCK